jgi:superkiller protein 3
LSAKVNQLVHDLVSQGRWDEAYSVLVRWAGQQPQDPDVQYQVGSLCYTIGRFHDAERHLRNALSVAPNPDANYYLGLTLCKLNRPQEAIACFREACEKREGFATGHLHWGLALSQMGSFRGALGQFRQALKLNPRLVAAAYQAGIASYALGQYSDAVEFFAEACEKDQQLAEAFNGLGVALTALGQHEKALSCFGKAWTINDKLPIIQRNWAAALVNMGRLDEAAKHYQEAINMSPKVLEAKERALIYNDWGVNLFRQGRADESSEKLLNAVSIDPELLDARLNLGIVLNSLQEYEQGAEAFEKALELDGANPMTNMHLGVSYFLLGRYPEAWEKLSAARESETEGAVDLWMGYTQLAMGNLQGAEKHFERSVQLNPSNFLALDSLGVALALQDRQAEAVERFKQCLKVNDSFGLAHIHLARSLESAGRPSEAMMEYRVAVQKDPNCLLPEKEALEMLLQRSQYDMVLNKTQRLLELVPTDEDAQLALARALKAQGRLDDAEGVLSQTVAMHPGNGPAQVLQGQIFLSQGKLLEADEKFRTASTLFDGDVALYYGWGKCLALLGLSELALEKFQKANEIDPYDPDTYEAWGATLKALGRFGEAAEVFKRAADYL